MCDRYGDVDSCQIVYDHAVGQIFTLYLYRVHKRIQRYICVYFDNKTGDLVFNFHFTQICQCDAYKIQI